MTKRDVASEMTLDLCINEKDVKRESEAQPVVVAKNRARSASRRVLLSFGIVAPTCFVYF